jgi:hypothetical protein
MFCHGTGFGGERRINPAYENATEGIWFPALQMSPTDSSSPFDVKNRVEISPRNSEDQPERVV